MQTLKPEIKQRCLESVKIKGRLSYEFNKHMFTVERMIKGDSLAMITAPALRIISEELGLKEAELLQPRGGEPS